MINGGHLEIQQNLGARKLLHKQSPASGYNVSVEELPYVPRPSESNKQSLMSENESPRFADLSRQDDSDLEFSIPMFKANNIKMKTEKLEDDIIDSSMCGSEPNMALSENQMPMPQRLDFAILHVEQHSVPDLDAQVRALDDDQDEPDEGNPKQSDSEQPEEEKKEGALSNRKHQNFAQQVEQKGLESEVKENMKDAEHFLLQQLGVEELDNPLED